MRHPMIVLVFAGIVPIFSGLALGLLREQGGQVLHRGAARRLGSACYAGSAAAGSPGCVTAPPIVLVCQLVAL